MRKLICKECGTIIYENTDFKDVSIDYDYCYKCKMNPSERKKFIDNINKAAKKIRDNNIKKIIAKGNKISKDDIYLLDFYERYGWISEQDRIRINFYTDMGWS